MSQLIKCDRCGALLDPVKGWIFMDATFRLRTRDREGNGSDKLAKMTADREMDLCSKCAKAISDKLRAEDRS